MTGDGVSWPATALVLAPSGEAEAQRLLALFDKNGRQAEGDGLSPVDVQRPGIFHCEPALDPEAVGAATAARVAAWLGRAAGRAEPIVAVVDAARCRACSTCVDLCEFGAPQLLDEASWRTSWIDPLLCTGCGTCAAHCPSGAITAGYSTDAQLEAMLDAVLA